MSVLVFGVIVAVIAATAIGYVCASLDLRAPVRVKRLVIAVLVALTLSTALYAAEVVVPGCNDYEKYSFWWYSQLCFLGEHSS